MDTKLPSPLEHSFATLAVNSGYSPEDAPPHYPIVEPLVTSTTFQQTEPGVYEEFNFGRTGNPCRQSLERRLAALEGAKYAVTFPSGVSVAFAVGLLFRPGDHFLVSTDLYGGTMKCFMNMENTRGFLIEYVDLSGDVKAVLERKMRENTKLLFFETPTNPMLTMVDIEKTAQIAKKISKDVVIVVDNTFLTPYFQKPLDLGVTITMYSLTKYINGHADVIMGAAVTNSPKLYEELAAMQSINGMCPSPFDCYQVTRGSKTLALRLDKHKENSWKIAQFLEKNEFVTRVNHPKIKTHQSFKIAKKQANGHSGIISFDIRGGLDQARKFVASLKVIKLAPSLGMVDTAVALPALMTHNLITQEKRDQMGITDSLIRMSVGIEDANDLIKDIDQALKATYGE